MDTENDSAWAAQHALLYQIQMTRLYHQKRERFFALLDRWSKALALISGTAVFSSLLSSPEAKSIAGLLVSLVTLPSLVFSWSDKSRLHNELASEYARIEADILKEGILEWKSIHQFRAQVTTIGTKEPHSLSALIRQCQNELALAANQPEKVFPLTFREKFFIHLFDMPRDNLQK